MMPPALRIAILVGALRTWREFIHSGTRTIIRNCLHNRVPWAATSTSYKRMPETPVLRGCHFAAAVATNCDIGRNRNSQCGLLNAVLEGCDFRHSSGGTNHLLRAVDRGFNNFEFIIAFGCRLFRDQLANGSRRRRSAADTFHSRPYLRRCAFKFSLHPGSIIGYPAIELKLFGGTVHERTKTDSLDNSGNR